MSRKFAVATTARPAYYDRNPLILGFSVHQTFAPHGATDRWSYTVPAGRKAQLEYAFVRTRRTNLATTPNDFDALLRINPAGGGTIVLVLMPVATNTVEAGMTVSVSGPITLNTGDRLFATTIDQSVDGLVTYTITAKLLEYDA